MENKKILESYSGGRIRSPEHESENVVYVTDPSVDEIDLGALVRNLFAEWKAILLVMIIGLVLSVVGSYVLTRSHTVEAVVRLPSANELGDIHDQNLIEISPDKALTLFVDQLNSPDNQVKVFEKSELFEELSEDSLLTPAQIFSDVRSELSVNRVKHDYYELEKDEKTPFKEVSVALVSSEPQLAADYIRLFINQAEEMALAELFNDIAVIKDNRIQKIKEQLESLTLAADASRQAQIARLEEKNQESIAGLQMQIELEISTAKKNRENQMIRVKEALTTAEALNIVDPVTWDDLRTKRINPQITNEFGGTDKSIPHYFQGTRILSAELNRLTSRLDDRPFIKDLTGLEKQIEALVNDPKIAALKARKDDTIYIEKFDEMQRKLSELIQTPIQFNNVHLAVVSQQPVVSPKPTRNPYTIIIVGLFLSGILALFIALIRISLLRKDDSSTSEIPLNKT